MLNSGSSVLIDVFVAEPGVFIVLADTVMLVDRAGQKLKTVSWPRDITSAAFDGESLVVADKAKLTTLDFDLNEIASGDLVETCASYVIVSGSRFVCGPENDWDRVFYTYDAKTAGLLASSDMYTYNGIPMRRIPGTDDFVTVTVGSSPSDFHLYSVVANGEAVFVNESPYHGDFAVTNIYSFDGSPPGHLVTHEGLMLKIYGDKCNAAESSFSSECFVKDGSLGTLTGSAVFLGMDSDASGKIYGIVDPSPDFSPFDPHCKSASCLIQRIDAASKTIEAQSIHSLELGEVIAARHDSVSGSLVVGYRLGEAYYFPSDPYPGYNVALISYE